MKKIEFPKKHKYSNLGYVYERNGIGYTYVDGKRKTTKVPFNDDNKNVLLSYLTAEIESVYFKETITEYTLFDLYDKFMLVHKPNYTKQRTCTFNHIISTFFPDNLMLSDIDEIRNMILNTSKKLTLKNQTINKYLRMLRQIFNFGIENKMLSDNPVTLKMLPKFKTNTEPYIFTIDELKLIFNQFKKNKKHYYYLLFLYYSGCRSKEICNSDLTIRNNSIKIIGKGDRPRIIPLDTFPKLKKVVQIINNYKFEYDNYTVNYISKRLRKILRRLNIYEEWKNLHTFRRTRENIWLDKINNIKVVAELIGHTPTVQEKHYNRTHSPEQTVQLLYKYLGKNSTKKAKIDKVYKLKSV